MPEYTYDKDKIKYDLTEEQIFDYLAELGGDPRYEGGYIISRTVCHCGQSHKLWYYPNTHLFHCFTDCAESFDIFGLTQKVNSQNREGYELPQAIHHVAQYFGYQPKETSNGFENREALLDWEVLDKYSRINAINRETKTIELKEYDGGFLKNLPHPAIMNWHYENISQSAMDRFEIAYEPKECSIVIPHRDINGKLVGVRQRTLITENAELYGKYRPLYLNGTLYNHPLAYNLYGLYQNKEAIKKFKTAIILEAEKSVLQLDGILGSKNNIGVACCGSALIPYQVKLLKDIGVQNVVVAFDHQFKDVNSEEAKKMIRNLKNIHKKYANYINISIMWDKENLTPYKSSPTDNGADIFNELWEKRINIYN